MPIKLGDNLTLYDVKELAEQFHITPLTIKYYIKSGRLKGQKMSKKWYVSETSLNEFFNQLANRPISKKTQKKNNTPF
jgi:predicted site-specific integrase-resolvase